MAESARPEQPSEEPRPKRRRGRVALHVSHVTALVVAALLLLYLTVLPVVVRRVVKNTLADLGYPNARFVVRNASLWGVELGDVRPAGEDTVIRSAIIRFSPIEVFGGRLRDVTLSGADVPAGIRDGQVTFALTPRGTGGSGDKSAGKGGGGLPFRRLDVVASTLRINWEGRDILLPVEGALIPSGREAAVEFYTFFQGTRIPVIGKLDPDGTAVELSASATNLSVSGIRSAVPWALLSYPFQTSGRADVRAAYSLSDGGSAVNLHVEPKNVWLAAQPGGHQLAVQRVDGAVDLQLRPGPTTPEARGTLHVGKVAWDTWAAEAVELAVRGGHGDAVEFEGALRSEGWRLTNLKGSLTDWTNGRPKVDATIRAKGRLPKRVLTMLADAGVDATHMADVAVAATLSASADGAKASDVEVVVDPGVVKLSDGGVVLSGVRGRIAGSVTAGPTGVVAELRPGSQAAIDAVKTPAGLTVKAGGASVEVTETAAIKSDTDSTDVRLPKLRISLGGVGVTDPAARTNVAGGAGVLNLGGEIAGRKVTMAVLPDSWLGFGSLQSGDGDSAVRAAATRFDLLPAAGGAPLLDGGRVAARLRSEAAVSLSAGTTKVSVKSMDLSAATEPGGGVRAEVRVDGGSVAQPSWTITDVTAHVPVGWGAPADGAGEFRVGAVSAAGQTLPPVSGTIRVVDKSVALTARTEIGKGAAVTGDANVEWTATGMHGRIATTMPAYHIEDAKELAHVWKGAGDFELTGTVSVGGSVLFNGPLIKPNIVATVKDGHLASKEYDLVVDGMNGGVTIDSFDPVSGPGLQRLRVDKLHVGKLDMTAGGVEFRIERPDSLHIERSRWSWAGGHLYTYDLRVNPTNPTDLNAVVYADRLDLKRLLGTLAPDQASGSGQLYGRLPVRLNWPAIAFGQGFLYATGSGDLQLGQKADTISSLLDSTDPRFATDPTFKQVKARILDALRNFNYDILKVDFLQNDSGGLTASITTHGKGQTGPKPQELNLTVNVNGVDQLLAEALLIKKAMGQ